VAIYVPWLADAARMTGYPVVEVGGWQQRGHGGMRLIEGVVCHHTADGATGDYPSLRIVRDGRAGLAGPLSAYGLGRNGTIFVIAAGESWHAGASAWAGFRDLGDEFIGIEAESVGTRNDWTNEQRDCYPRLVAAILHFMRRGADRCAGHREIALPKGRKIDPAFWDMNDFRRIVSGYLANPSSINRQGGGGEDLRDDERAALFTILAQHIGSTNPNEFLGFAPFEGTTSVGSPLTNTDYGRQAVKRVDETAGGIIANAQDQAAKMAAIQKTLEAILSKIESTGVVKVPWWKRLFGG
jgi:N-acetylmuramoyl-L-alanine amidase